MFKGISNEQLARRIEEIDQTLEKFDIFDSEDENENKKIDFNLMYVFDLSMERRRIERELSKREKQQDIALGLQLSNPIKNIILNKLLRNRENNMFLLDLWMVLSKIPPDEEFNILVSEVDAIEQKCRELGYKGEFEGLEEIKKFAKNVKETESRNEEPQKE